MVQALLAAHADLNAKTTDGMTALRLATQKGHAEVVQALLAAQAVGDVKKTGKGRQEQAP